MALTWRKGIMAGIYHAEDDWRAYEIRRTYEVDPRAHGGTWRLIVRATDNPASPELIEFTSEQPRNRAEAIEMAEIYRRRGVVKVSVDTTQMINEFERCCRHEQSDR